jgi:hypothetical protein
VWSHILRNLDLVKGLKKTNDEERSFVIGELLSETDTWPGVEREENVWIRDEVLLEPVIKPAVRIEFSR